MYVYIYIYIKYIIYYIYIYIYLPEREPRIRAGWLTARFRLAGGGRDTSVSQVDVNLTSRGICTKLTHLLRAAWTSVKHSLPRFQQTPAVWANPWPNPRPACLHLICARLQPCIWTAMHIFISYVQDSWVQASPVILELWAASCAKKVARPRITSSPARGGSLPREGSSREARSQASLVEVGASGDYSNHVTL